jgi:hypothetical protein
MSTQPSPITPRGRPHSVTEAPVSPQYAAHFLNMHPKTVLRKAREGTLPAHPIGRVGLRSQMGRLVPKLRPCLTFELDYRRH